MKTSNVILGAACVIGLGLTGMATITFVQAQNARREAAEIKASREAVEARLMAQELAHRRVEAESLRQHAEAESIKQAAEQAKAANKARLTALAREAAELASQVGLLEVDKLPVPPATSDRLRTLATELTTAGHADIAAAIETRNRTKIERLIEGW